MKFQAWMMQSDRDNEDHFKSLCCILPPGRVVTLLPGPLLCFSQQIYVFIICRTFAGTFYSIIAANGGGLTTQVPRINALQIATPANGAACHHFRALSSSA